MFKQDSWLGKASLPAKELGKRGEETAVALLKENGYRILFKNYKTKLGEIDIIAFDKGTISFIEVKTRQSDRFGAPSEAISKAKQGQISKAALTFLKEKGLLDKRARFDVVLIMNSRDGAKSDLIKGAFELSGEYTY